MIPELLTAITVEQVGAYVLNPAYALEPKRDGRRVILSKLNGRAQAFNKRGEPCTAPPALLNAVPDGVTLDGELEPGRRYITFDLLDCFGLDIRPLSCRKRREALREIISRGALSLPHGCSVIQSWESSSEKESALFRGVAERWEGVVFKNLDAPYASGRSGQHVKLKFVKSCTVRVRKVEPTRAEIEMLEPDRPMNDRWTVVSGVSLIGRPRVKVGDFLEVNYLYATVKNGLPKLDQPVMLMLRDDVTDADCSTEQLIFKAVMQ
jgi:bifunctional non-homologous end joining protein LigD